MIDKVRVRLVPKTKAGKRGPLAKRTFSPHMVLSEASDADKAVDAELSSRSLGLDAFITPQSNIDGSVDLKTFETLFQTKMIERKCEDVGLMTPSRTGKTIIMPESELKVPDQLSDTIDFAYVPTIPDYHNISFVPPNTSLYHLRLSDVSRSLNVEHCHRRDWTGKGIKIGMADTGFSKHPFFDENGFSISRIVTLSTPNPEYDPSGHGTGESANALWIAPDCRFIGVKDDVSSATALEVTIGEKPHVMTHSWGFDIDYTSKEKLQETNPNLFNEVIDIEQILAMAIDSGIVTIFSAGNGHRAFPACIPDVIAVGGVTVMRDGDLKASNYASSFVSQFYPGRRVPDFCGVVGEAKDKGPMPGHIMLPVPNDSELEGENLPKRAKKQGWGIFSGTSAAAPQLAGIVALMLEVNSSLTPEDVKQILADTAREVTQGQSSMGDEARIGYDLATGAGFIDAFKACLRAERFIIS